jgi:drug/metabolite transporter (DMT)-like permease
MKFLQNERFVNTALAWTFVVIWGSGFVATKVALQYTSPLVFLTIRFGLGVLCLGVFALFARLNWPRSPMQWLHIVVAGLLVNAALRAVPWHVGGDRRLDSCQPAAAYRLHRLALDE